MHRDQAAPEQMPVIRELLLYVTDVLYGLTIISYLGNTIGPVHPL
jgi:hypothetical protein